MQVVLAPLSAKARRTRERRPETALPRITPSYPGLASWNGDLASPRESRAPNVNSAEPSRWPIPMRNERFLAGTTTGRSNDVRLLFVIRNIYDRLCPCLADSAYQHRPRGSSLRLSAARVQMNRLDSVKTASR